VLTSAALRHHQIDGLAVHAAPRQSEAGTGRSALLHQLVGVVDHERLDLRLHLPQRRKLGQ